METESEPLNPNLIQIESKLEIDQPLGEIIKKKKDKKKAKKEKLIEQLEKKRKIDDYSQEFSSGNSEAAKKIKFDNIFDAQKAQGLKGRDFTVSLALAGSILDNAQSAELRTYLAGQIARALAVFNIDEVIIFSDDKETEFAQGNSQLVNILKYLECPQYLRKDLFPIHRYYKNDRKGKTTYSYLYFLNCLHFQILSNLLTFPFIKPTNFNAEVQIFSRSL